MVEVFKTNVENIVQAHFLKNLLQQKFAGYQVTFDLTDCDRILRIAFEGLIHPGPVIHLLSEHGFRAEVLPDIMPSLQQY